MNWRKFRCWAATIGASGLACLQVEAAPGPIRVSPDGRYFVDARGEPFYFLADTQWELFRRFSLSDSREHAESWLGFNSIQVWNQIDLVFPMTRSDARLSPPKPATMLEGAYENGEEYGFPIPPLLVRREAYYTCLAGGFHGYGHNDCWRVKARWRAALDDPGARQMTILKSLFTSLPEWWTLTPDQSILSAGGNTRGDALNLGARSRRGQWIVAYVAGEPSVEVDLSKLTASVRLSCRPSSGSPCTRRHFCRT
jgi:hypothetical protein